MTPTPITPAPIDRFSGVHRFLSSFYTPAPTAVCINGVWELYPTSEHAFHAAKFPGHPEIRAAIARAATPAEAKRLGHSAGCRVDWDTVRVPTMGDVVLDKFTRTSQLARWLLLTGTAELIEGNRHGDTFWGTVNGRGENHLGKCLMRVRVDPRVRRAAESQ